MISEEKKMATEDEMKMKGKQGDEENGNNKKKQRAKKQDGH